MNIKQSTIDESVEMYKNGASRMEIARYISENENKSISQSKVYSKRIWDDNFEEAYVPLSTKSQKQKKDDQDEFDFVNSDIQEPLVDDTDNKDGTKSFSVKGNGFIPTLDEIYELVGLDKTEWSISDLETGTYQVARKNKSSDLSFEEGRLSGKVVDDGGMYVQPLYKLKFKAKRMLPMPVKELIEEFKENTTAYAPTILNTPKINRNGRLMVIALVDQHLGKITVDHSFKDICQSYKDAFSYFLHVADFEEVEKILMITGHDFFNIDNIANMTTGGTPQNNNVTWKKLFQEGCKVNIDCIESALKIAPVEIMNVPGNHDEQTAFAMGEYLGAWFRNSPHVSIDNDGDTYRKYYKWGKCLLGSTHCRYEKVKELPLTMAVESKHFSECEYRHFFLGHIHTQKMYEDHGVVTEYLPTLSSWKEDYHLKYGYVGNQNCSKAFIFDKKYGQMQNYYYREKMDK